MPSASLLALTLVGLLFGSLAGGLSYRLPRGLPIGSDRSRCPSCRATLGPVDLIPVLSWLMLRGRCRHCGKPVSWRYPVIELVTAALFLWSGWLSGADLPMAVMLSLTAFGLVVIAVVDLEAGIIPDGMLLFLIPLAVLWRRYGDGEWLDASLGALLAGSISYGVRWGFLRWRRRDGLGLGDVKFLCVAGFYVGLSGLGGYLVASALLGICLGFGWRLGGRGPVFPFGPALCAGLLLATFFPDIFLRLVE
ncbi:prepilin peptidase [Telmatospirillum sp.]|uniref:prepilin peptidase n=1 Tax=Telmatospirillum sp. TaxID=2079197 RepID=UPI0028489D05|nr:prepilin peptidase [Telmatospirillum sp.]MDR3440067.1 prepilin peptidase [Telmatospirillum sp.]